MAEGKEEEISGGRPRSAKAARGQEKSSVNSGQVGSLVYRREKNFSTRQTENRQMRKADEGKVCYLQGEIPFGVKQEIKLSGENASHLEGEKLLG